MPISGTQQEIAQWVTAAREVFAVGSTQQRGGRLPRTTSTQLPGVVPLRRLCGALLPSEVWDRIQGARRVVLIPDGVLHRFPMEALVVGANDKGVPIYWLDQGPPITYLPSLSAFTALRERAQQQREEGGASLELVAVGDPVFTLEEEGEHPNAREGKPLTLKDGAQDRFGKLIRLPGTREEVLKIAERFDRGQIQLLTDKNATEAKLLECASKARILHIATHGLLNEIAGHSFSALALTVPRQPTPRDDGFLRLTDLFEAWRGRLRSCEMVVLSGCETHSGNQQLDEAPHALSVGFLFAGASSVVASLWKVNDVSTAKLMSEFYRPIAAKDGEEDRLEALVQAKKHLKAQYPSPRHWAPFIYIGDP